MKFTLTAVASILATPLAVLAGPASPSRSATPSSSVKPFSLVKPSSSATQVSVSYDNHYDDPNLDLRKVSCSDGENGLVPKGYQTAGSLPKFPFVGGAMTIPGWNSPNCGKCYSLTWNNNTIYVTAIDAAPQGFNIAFAAMDKLTGGLATQLGRVTATYAPAAPSECGF